MMKRHTQPGSRRHDTSRAFTLIELLVVVSIIALLVSMMLPTLTRAKEQARSTLCRTNLAGLAKANLMYADENRGYLVPAASDILVSSGGNLNRWHGTRKDMNSPFDPAASPLAKFMGNGTKLKQCPSFRDFVSKVQANAYESGAGGYGYSDWYLGSRFWETGFSVDSPGQLAGAKVDEVRNPTETVMFTDVAMAQGNYYTEESFAICPMWVDSDNQPTTTHRTPTIHFRHNGYANVSWADSHATGRSDMHSVTTNVYNANPQAMGIGWFGPDDNSLFDLQ